MLSVCCRKGFCFCAFRHGADGTAAGGYNAGSGMGKAEHLRTPGCVQVLDAVFETKGW